MHTDYVRNPGGTYPPHGPMQVIASLDLAIKHTRRVLFTPFAFGKWFAFGVIIFISMLGGTSGMSYSANFRNLGQQTPEMPDISEMVRGGEKWVADHLDLVLAVAIPAVLLGLLFWIFLVWLGSHGQMMLVRAVALDDAGVGENWTDTRQEAWSLFLFRVFLTVAGGVISMGFLVSFYFLARPIVLADTGGGGFSLMTLVVALLPLITAFAICAFVLNLAGFLLGSFVVPLMFHFRVPCLRAWGILFQVLSGNILRVIGFACIRFVYQIAFGICTIVVTCCTFCIAAIPVVNQTIFAPYYVFDRSFSLFLIHSLGPDYAIVRLPDYGPPPAAPGPGLQEGLPPLDRYDG